jgi:hypothetical protein
MTRPIRWFLTARDSDARLTEQVPLAPAADEPGPASVRVDAGHGFQEILGFGGASPRPPR